MRTARPDGEATLLTQKLFIREKEPVIALDARAMTNLKAASAIVKFVDEQGISVLNIAGPRLTGQLGIASRWVWSVR
jgi:Circularly permutated YpsA SLOG family